MKQPAAIKILVWFAALACAGMFLSIPLVYFGIAPAMMGGEPVTRSEWLHIAAPLVAVIGILMALSSYGLATRKPWARRAVMAIPILIVSYAVAIGAPGWIKPVIMWRAVINGSILGCLSVWYFYFKPNVAKYFRELQDRHRP